MSEMRGVSAYRSHSIAGGGSVNVGSGAGSSGSVSHLERDLIQLRQDLSASQEIIRLLQTDNATLKAAVAHHKANTQKEVSSRQALVDAYEGKLREMVRQVDEHTREKIKMAAEVSEALNERERQASAIADVRKSVDARLTRLMEEVHRKDEELHKLQFAMSERERDRERVAMLEKMLSSREESTNMLVNQIATVRGEHSEIAAQLKQKTQMVEDLTANLKRLQQTANESAVANFAANSFANQQGVGGTPSRAAGSYDAGAPSSNQPMPSGSDLASAKEILAILPLYRQWSGDLRGDLELVDDGLDALMDVAVDLRTALYQCGGSSTGHTFGPFASSQQHDRQRLHRMRQMEKERAKQQANLMLNAAIHSDDPQGVHIHAIRAISDHSRYEMDRVKETVASLADCLEQLQKDVATRALPFFASVNANSSINFNNNTNSLAPTFGGDAGAIDNSSMQYTEQVSVAGAPLTPSVVRISTATASAQAAEISRLHEVISVKDQKLLDTQRDVFEWREKASAAESQVRILERDLSRAIHESDSLRTDLKRAEEEGRSLKNSMAVAELEHSRALDSSRREQTQLIAAHTQTLRQAEDEHRAAMVNVSERLESELRDAKSEISALRRSIEDSTAIETKLRAVLEESKQKRLEWKRAKETSDEELAEARALLSNQNRELRQAQEMVDSLSAELTHVKDVLDFEVSQQERRALAGAMGGSGGNGYGGDEGSLFQQWKNSHREEIRNAQAATSRQPRKVVVRRKM